MFYDYLVKTDADGELFYEEGLGEIKTWQLNASNGFEGLIKSLEEQKEYFEMLICDRSDLDNKNYYDLRLDTYLDPNEYTVFQVFGKRRLTGDELKIYKEGKLRVLELKRTEYERLKKELGM